MKYAIIESGGKQYRAVEGEKIDVDRLPLDTGETVELDQVLLLANEGDIKVGAPIVEGAKVKATVVEQVKGRKIIVFKYKSGVNYRRKQGHRQQYTRLHIDEIVTG